MEALMDVIQVILLAIIAVLLILMASKSKSVAQQSPLLYPEVKNSAEGEKIKVLLPLKLKAYERLVIFMERINPSSLIMRVSQSGMSATQLQLELLRAVREEYEHNLSLQIYVSEEAWRRIETAKDEVLSLIKIASSKTGNQGSGTDLSRIILEIDGSVQENPVKKAVTFLKKEIRNEIA